MKDLFPGEFKPNIGRMALLAGLICISSGQPPDALAAEFRTRSSHEAEIRPNRFQAEKLNPKRFIALIGGISSLKDPEGLSLSLEGDIQGAVPNMEMPALIGMDCASRFSILAGNGLKTTPEAGALLHVLLGGEDAPAVFERLSGAQGGQAHGTPSFSGDSALLKLQSAAKYYRKNPVALFTLMQNLNALYAGEGNAPGAESPVRAELSSFSDSGEDFRDLLRHLGDRIGTENAFELVYESEALQQMWALKNDKGRKSIWKAVVKALKLLAANPRNHSLNTHKIVLDHAVANAIDDEIFEAYATLKQRIFWRYAHGKRQIVIMAVAPHSFVDQHKALKRSPFSLQRRSQ